MSREVVDLETDPLAFGPPEETVWRKYSSNLEFPISLLISTFLLTSMFAILVGLLFLALGSGPEKKLPPISFSEGDDDTGQGSPGTGGNPNDALVKSESKPDTTGTESSKEDFTLPEIQQIKDAIALDDPTNEPIAVAPENAKAYQNLDEALRNKLLNIGGKKGAGNSAETGSGKEGSGTGPGGVGADRTRARSLRWVMLFKTNGGRDYLDQLNSLGAVVLVSLPSDKKSMYIFRDLRNPQPGTLVKEEELIQFSQQIQFCDDKPSSAKDVGRALNLNFVPDGFWAIFPKGIEEQLAKLERDYRNRRPEDIEQTKFQVSVIGGQYRLVVSEQTERLRRK
ncbi:MAG: hypothetical protein ACRC8S_00675 [Fimbriiglobus sp.]